MMTESLFFDVNNLDSGEESQLQNWKKPPKRKIDTSSDSGEYSVQSEQSPDHSENSDESDNSSDREQIRPRQKRAAPKATLEAASSNPNRHQPSLSRQFRTIALQ